MAALTADARGRRIGSLFLLHLSGDAWIAGFVAFVLLYGPLLAMRKPAWKNR